MDMPPELHLALEKYCFSPANATMPIAAVAACNSIEETGEGASLVAVVMPVRWNNNNELCVLSMRGDGVGHVAHPFCLLYAIVETTHIMFHKGNLGGSILCSCRNLSRMHRHCITGGPAAWGGGLDIATGGAGVARPWSARRDSFWPSGRPFGNIVANGGQTTWMMMSNIHAAPCHKCCSLPPS